MNGRVHLIRQLHYRYLLQKFRYLLYNFNITRLGIAQSPESAFFSLFEENGVENIKK